MRGISIKAVLLATLAALGLDFASAVVLMSVFGDAVIKATDEQTQAAIAALHQDPAYMTGVLVLGTASTVVGGYLAARLANSVPYFHALAFGVLGVLLGAWASAGLPVWSRVAGLGLTIPAALLGAYLSKRRIRA